MRSQQIAHRHLLHISIGQTPVFQKEVYKFKRMWYTYIIKEEMPMAAKNRVTYHEENINANTLKLREVLDTMPRFSKDFFQSDRTK